MPKRPWQIANKDLELFTSFVATPARDACTSIRIATGFTFMREAAGIAACARSFLPGETRLVFELVKLAYNEIKCYLVGGILVSMA